MKALIEKTEKNIFTIAVSRNSTSPALLKEFQQLWQVPCFSQHITGHQKSIRFATEYHIQDNHNSKLEYQEMKRLLKQATITIWYKHSGGTQQRTLKIQSTTTQKPKNKTKLQCDGCFFTLLRRLGGWRGKCIWASGCKCYGDKRQKELKIQSKATQKPKNKKKIAASSPC